MKAKIYLGDGKYNPISLDGTLVEFMQGSTGSATLVMSGGENNKKFGNLFGEIRKDNKKETVKGLVEGAICIVEEKTETLYFPAPVRVHII